MFRGTGRKAKALELGTVAHQALAAKLEKREAFAYDATDWDLTWIKEADALVEQVMSWEPPSEWIIHATEVRMKLKMGRHELVGTLDAIVEWNAQAWHLQHKTLDARVPLEVYSELMRNDWHEVVYQRMAEEAGYKPFGGTILNVMRKGVEKPFSLHYLTRTQEDVEGAMVDICALLDDVEEQYRGELPKHAARLDLKVRGELGEEGKRIIRNRQACGGPFRNSKCAYMPVCGGETTIDDERYQDLEWRYA